MPLLPKEWTITDQLALKHKVLEGMAEFKEVGKKLSWLNLVAEQTTCICVSISEIFLLTYLFTDSWSKISANRNEKEPFTPQHLDGRERKLEWVGRWGRRNSRLVVRAPFYCQIAASAASERLNIHCIDCVCQTLAQLIKSKNCYYFLGPTSTKPQAEILKLNNVNGCNDIKR